MKKNYLLNLLSLFAGLTATAQCLMYEVPLKERTAASPVIMEGRVLSKNSFWNPGHTNIYTAHTVEVLKVFKGGITAAEVEVITPGGIVDKEMEIVTPSLELRAGETGIFFIQPSGIINSPGPLSYQLKFEPYASAQSFARYDLTDRTASDVFNVYKNIETELYDAIQSQLGAGYRVVKHFEFPAAAVSKTHAPPSISGFSPTSITAGTLSTLTINGSNFGTNTGSAKVEFKNADDGGSTYLTAGAKNIVSWSATQIKVMVPTKCGTGTVRVTDNAGASATSGTSVTMPYGQITATDGSGVENRLKLANKNSAGGYNFKYCTTFNNNAAAVAAFERALTTWRCATLVNFQKGGTTADVCHAKDGNNIVNFDGACKLGPSLLGICNSYFDACSASGTWYWTLTEMDIRFSANAAGGSWNYGPAATSGGKYDFETTALHEIGHAHLLAHVIDAPALMHWVRNSNTDVRTLGSNDLSCANDVLTRSTTGNPCGATVHTKISSAGCTVGIEDAFSFIEDVVVSPNPVSGNGVLRISSALLAKGEVQFEIYDLLGNKVKSFRGIRAERFLFTMEDLAKGMYTYRVTDGTGAVAGSGKLMFVSGQ